MADTVSRWVRYRKGGFGDFEVTLHESASATARVADIPVLVRKTTLIFHPDEANSSGQLGSFSLRMEPVPDFQVVSTASATAPNALTVIDQCTMPNVVNLNLKLVGGPGIDSGKPTIRNRPQKLPFAQIVMRVMLGLIALLLIGWAIGHFVLDAF